MKKRKSGYALMMERKKVMIFFICLLAIVCVCTTAEAARKTWTGGAGDHKWESGANWNPPGEPGPGDDVVIPPDQGEITVKGPKQVKSLDIKDSKGGGGTTIRPRGKTFVRITCGGDIKIGKGNTIRGNDGADGQIGGNVDITSDNGDVTNKGKVIGGRGGNRDGGKKAKKGGDVKVKAKNGKITNGRDGEMQGGDSGNGLKPKKGGDVIVDGKNVDNQGKEIGGKGGDYTGKKRKPGADGGNVKNVASNQCRPGKKKGGDKGEGNNNDGSKRGRVTSSGEEFLALLPGDYHTGDIVTLLVGSKGKILMAGLSVSAIKADDSIIIDASSEDNTIDLTGNSAGTDIIVAGRQICIFGNMKLDPEVSIASITNPDAIDSDISCLPQKRLLKWGSIMLALVILIVIIVLILRRKASLANEREDSKR